LYAYYRGLGYIEFDAYYIESALTSSYQNDEDLITGAFSYVPGNYSLHRFNFSGMMVHGYGDSEPEHQHFLVPSVPSAANGWFNYTHCSPDDATVKKNANVFCLPHYNGPFISAYAAYTACHESTYLISMPDGSVGGQIPTQQSKPSDIGCFTQGTNPRMSFTAGWIKAGLSCPSGPYTNSFEFLSAAIIAPDHIDVKTVINCSAPGLNFTSGLGQLTHPAIQYAGVSQQGLVNAFGQKPWNYSGAWNFVSQGSDPVIGVFNPNITTPFQSDFLLVQTDDQLTFPAGTYADCNECTIIGASNAGNFTLGGVQYLNITRAVCGTPRMSYTSTIVPLSAFNTDANSLPICTASVAQRNYANAFVPNIWLL